MAEIDLLAVNLTSGEKFHIEVRVTIDKAFRIRLIDSQTRSGRKHKRGIDTLSAIKFSPPIVVDAVTEFCGSGEYKKILVVWAVEDEKLIEEAKKLYGIEIWKMPDILSSMAREVKTRAYRDDVLRTIQLISLGTETEQKTQKIDETLPSVYPVETTINAYTFLKVPARVMSALGIEKNNRNDSGKKIYDITKACITDFDLKTKTMSVKLEL